MHWLVRKPQMSAVERLTRSQRHRERKKERKANRESEKMTGRQTKRLTNKRKETSEVDGLWSKPRKMLLPVSVWRLSRGSSTASLMFLCDQTAHRRAQVAVIAGPNISLVVFLPHKAAGADRGPVVWRTGGALASGQRGSRVFSVARVIWKLAILESVGLWFQKKKRKRINKTPNKCWQLLMAGCANTKVGPLFWLTPYKSFTRVISLLYNADVYLQWKILFIKY